jgi:hypothetical protein
MFTSKWRHLCFSCSLLIMPLAANPADSADDCGRLLSGPQHRHIVYVLCPSLPELDQEQAHTVVMAVLDTTTRRSGDTLILFFADESAVHGDLRPWITDRRIERWGNAFVGSYNTASNLLTVRSGTGDKWRNIYLPTQKDLANRPTAYGRKRKSKSCVSSVFDVCFAPESGL